MVVAAFRGRFEGRDASVRAGEIKGHTHPVQAHGTISGPAVALHDTERIRLQLTAVIDRTKYRLEWDAPCLRAAALRSVPEHNSSR